MKRLNLALAGAVAWGAVCSGVLPAVAAAAPSVEHGALCLTFDDRNFDAWEANLPLFRKYGAHATFFVCGPIDDRAAARRPRRRRSRSRNGTHPRARARCAPRQLLRGGNGAGIVAGRRRVDATARLRKIRRRQFALARKDHVSSGRQRPGFSQDVIQRKGK